MADGTLIFNTKIDSQGVSSGLRGIGSIAQNSLGVFTGNMMTRAVDGIKNLGMTAIGAYGDVQQSLGGIETLFGDVASKIITSSARTAYQMGIDYNRYMENAVGMSASMIQSLGGDQEKAAKKVNMAMEDMADNSAKMGTNIGMIQQAYQGFAKGNFTMLDNLKLGYGGTRTEMERLLAHADELNAAQGIYTQYSIDSYADITDAIHLVQKEMQISGVAAEEAKTTITGSINAMKASWTNLLAAMGDPDGDVDKAMDEFVQSLQTAWSNVAPTIKSIGKNILKMIGDGINEFISPFTKDFNGTIKRILDEASEFIYEISGGNEIVKNLADLISFLADNMDWLAPSIIAVVGAVESFNTAMAIKATIEGTVKAVNAFKTANDAASISQAVLNAVMNMNPFVLIATLIGAVVAALLFLWNTNEDFRNACMNAWNALCTTASNVFGGIASFFTQKIPKAIDDMLAKLKALPGEFVRVGKNIVDGLWNGISQGWQWLTNKVAELAGGLFNAAKNALGIHSPSRKFKYIGEMCVAGFDEGIEGLVDGSIFSDSVNASLGTVQSNINGAMLEGYGKSVFNFYDVQTSPDSIMRKADNTLQFGLAGGL